MSPHTYLDASAIVKLVVLEPEWAALQQFLRDRSSRLSSTLAEVEVSRALRRAGYGPPEQRRADEVLRRMVLVNVDRRLLRDATALLPLSLRSLDAIHLATALAVGDDLAGIVTYAHRLLSAAAAAGVEVWAPA